MANNLTPRQTELVKKILIADIDQQRRFASILLALAVLSFVGLGLIAPFFVADWVLMHALGIYTGLLFLFLYSARKGYLELYGVIRNLSRYQQAQPDE